MNPKSLFRTIFGKLEPTRSHHRTGRPAFKAHEGIWLDMFYSGHTDQGVFWYHENIRSRLD